MTFWTLHIFSCFYTQNINVNTTKKNKKKYEHKCFHSTIKKETCMIVITIIIVSIIVIVTIILVSIVIVS